MSQIPEADAFLKRLAAVPAGPGITLDNVLAPSIEDETNLRCLFATGHADTHLSNPYLGLVDVFSAPDCARTTRARVVKEDEDRFAKYVLPLQDGKRRKDGEASMVGSLEEFQKNWSIFTEGSLSQLTDWSNVVAAGGSVLACMQPMSDKDKETKRTIRKYYHSSAYPTSDVDLFLWGLTPEQAEIKINAIYEAVRDSVPWDVTCVRSKSAITIYSQFPYRCIQIVLRLYHSPAEILAGFDVDAACVAYDGGRVFANPRSIVAMMRQANTVDMTRRSPSYEIRLAKYASRGFEVYVPDLRRADVDPSIYERSLNRIEGLARLLVLERLSDPGARTSYLESRRSLRSRPPARHSRRSRLMRKRKGDLKADEEIAGLEMSDYDVTTLHLPYGPGWTAKRIEKLVWQTDLGTNSTFNSKNKDRRLHRHAAFFGTMRECLEDCCGYCPEPANDEKALQEEEDKSFIRGRVAFIQEDPGRQTMTGSFKPIDVGEWSEQAYLGPTEKLFNAIAANDRAAVQRMIKDRIIDINRRDHVGRTPLHVAILTKSVDICGDLVDAGARMTLRLVNGRTALHLAAQMDLPEVVQKLLEQNAINVERAKEAEADADAVKEATRKELKADAEEEDGEASDSDEERSSSIDDWSSEETEENTKKKADAKKAAPNDSEQPSWDIGDIPDDETTQPDILDIAAADWDLGFPPLAYAIATGSLRAIDLLLNAGADPKQTIQKKPNDHNSHTLHPLTVALITPDEDKAEAIVERLLRAGASSALAGSDLFSIFHAFVSVGKRRLVEKLLRRDPNAKAAIDIPAFHYSLAKYPIVTAAHNSEYAIAALLLGHGASVSYSADDLEKAKKLISANTNRHYYYGGETPHPLDYLSGVALPVEVSIASGNYLYRLFVDAGAQISVPSQAALSNGRYDSSSRLTLVELIEKCTENVVEEAVPATFKFPENPKTWADHRLVMGHNLDEIRLRLRAEGKDEDDEDDDGDCDAEKNEAENRRRAKYLEEALALLRDNNAATWDDIYPDSKEDKAANRRLPSKQDQNDEVSHRVRYLVMRKHWGTDTVLPHLLDQYDELFEACWQGDDAKVRTLCLPPPKKGAAKMDKAPIQIAVKCTGYANNLGLKTTNVWNDGAFTPLSVALIARKWKTAKLVMKIAMSQWKKPDPERENARFSHVDVDLNLPGFVEDDDAYDSDYDGDDDCYYDDNNGNIDSTFTDIAQRPTAVKCDVKPEKLFDEPISQRPSSDGRRQLPYSSVLNQALADGDLEAFVHIVDIMKALPEPQSLKADGLLCVLQSDNPDLFDDYIRRTAAGIPLDALLTRAKAKDADELETAAEAKEAEAEQAKKFYIGLSIHGKKRKDLARKDTPEDGHHTDVPIVWKAVRDNAVKIISYLAGSGPINAYRYFIRTAAADDIRAQALRKIPEQELERLLPKLLGLTPNSRRENAVTAAILGGGEHTLELTKRVLGLNPSQTRDYLQGSIRYLNLTPTLMAAAHGKEGAFFDFLFANGVSADVADKRGYNIYHYVCEKGHLHLLQYLLGKLRKDLTEKLLSCTSTSEYDGATPLMLAVKKGYKRIVEMLVRSKFKAAKESIVIRNAQGSNALHVAVHAGFAEISASLLALGGPELLYIESSVGETPLEAAEMSYIIHASRSSSLGNTQTVSWLNVRTVGLAQDPPREKELEKQLHGVIEVKSELEQQGKLIGNAKTRAALDSFINFLTAKFEQARAELNPGDTEKKPQKSALAIRNARVPVEDKEDKHTDIVDFRKTLEVVTTAAHATPGKRQLVHVADVQRSVANVLDKVTKNTNKLATLAEHVIETEDFAGENESEEEDEEDTSGILSWNGSSMFALDK